MSRLHLIEAYAVPLLTYAYEAVFCSFYVADKSMPCAWPTEIVFLKRVFTSSNNLLLVCGQNFCTNMKYKALCRYDDVDISQRFVSCQHLRKWVGPRPIRQIPDGCMYVCKFFLGVRTFICGCFLYISLFYVYLSVLHCISRRTIYLRGE